MNHDFIIIEGMDNTGKTTLIQRIIREYARGYSVSKVSLGPNCSDKEQKDWLTHNIDFIQRNPEELILYDRFLPICDTVYGNVLRGGSVWSIDNPQLRVIKDSYNPLIIYCRPHIDVITGFSDGRDQMEGVEENAIKLVEAYDRMISDLKAKYGYDILVYDFNYKEDHQRVKEAVINILNKKKNGGV